MKISMVFSAAALSLAFVFGNGCVVPAGPPPPPPPPPPMVETYDPAPYPDGIWVGGAWEWRPEYRRYEWRRGEWRHRGERFHEERR